MYRRSLSNLLGGSALLVGAAAALYACGGGEAAGGETTMPSSSTPSSSAAGMTASSTGTAGKPASTPSGTTGTAGAKAAGGTTTSGVTSAAGTSGSAGSTAAAAGGSTGAAGGGMAAAAGGKAAAAGTTGGGAAGGGAAAAAGSSGAATTGGPLKYTGMFTMGMTIPKANKCPSMGDNKSPALAWTGGPADTKSYALVLYDTGFMMLHYVLWDIPATVHELPAEGLGAGYDVPNLMGAHQAAAMCNNMPAYCGPCSGGGGVIPASTYEYRLYAMKVDKLGLMENSTASQAQMAVESMMLEKAVWTGKPE